jgi:hypothetical protein
VPVKIVKVEDPHFDACWRAERCFRVIGQQAPSLSVGALALFGIGLAIAQPSPGGGASMRPVPLSEIERQATISVAQGVTLDFSDGGANNVMVKTTDNPGVVQITSKTNAVTVGPGAAHVDVATFGQCPKPTGMQVVSCDPIPVYSVTINVRYQP